MHRREPPGVVGTPTDGDVVRAARAGDPDAVVELYQRHVATVRSAVAGRVRGADLVEEVTQEAFTRALERLDDLRRPERFRPWLLAIARHVATDRWRLERRQRGVDPDELCALSHPAPGADDGALHLVTDLVGRCLGRLSERDAMALALVTERDLGPAEVGTALGLTTGAAKVAVHRARRRLRTALAADVLADVDGLACGDHPGPAAPARAAARHVSGCAVCLSAIEAHLATLVA
jgi:RNA polymerase sigma-70 factor (ECF subfamily)